MANSTISMSKIRHIFRLYSQGHSKLSITTQIGVSRNTVKRYLTALVASGLTYDEIRTLTDKDLEDLFGKPPELQPEPRLVTLQASLPQVDKELKRKGVTRLLLWQAYRNQHPDGFQYTQFCFYYNRWKARVNPVMHLDHKAGDKLFVDFAGVKLSLLDQQTGEEKPVEIFIAVLGASQLTYVQAVMSQQKEDFIAACEAALQYYGGVPAAIVPDNLKAAVTKSSRFEPTLNETFADFAEHYGTTILPTRAYRPRDKALVEGAVKIIYNRIYAPLGQQAFSSLAELNVAILGLLEQHNSKPLKGRNYSRRLQFEEVEREALAPLPVLPYEFKKQAHATVMKNGHVCLGADKHYYSVPYRYVGRKVKLLYSSSTVEIFVRYQRVALHRRQHRPYSYTTDKEHLASTHRFVAEWSPDRFVDWAADIHEDVRQYVLKVIERRQHPEQAYRSCMGILSLASKVGKERLTNACRRALGFGLYNYKTVQTILEKGMDNYDDEDLLSEPRPMPSHENIRGEDYYQ